MAYLNEQGQVVDDDGSLGNQPSADGTGQTPVSPIFSGNTSIVGTPMQQVAQAFKDAGIANPTAQQLRDAIGHDGAPSASELQSVIGRVRSFAAASSAQNLAEQTTRNQVAGGSAGSGSTSQYQSFDDYWNNFNGFDLASAASQWNTDHPNDQVQLTGHSGDAAIYRGQEWDWIRSVGSPDQAKQKIPTGGGQNPTGGNNYGLGQFTGTFQDPTSPVNPYTPGSYTPDTFTAPTGVDDSNDPGFDARLKAGQQALERSASSRGTLLSGGTLKALTRYAQDYASNEYSNVYGRDLTTFNTNESNKFNAYRAGEQDKFNAFTSQAGVTSDQFNRALSSFNTNTGLYTDAYNRARTDQNDLFGQQYALTSLGLGATNSLVNNNTGLTGSVLDAIYKNLGVQNGSASDIANATGANATANANTTSGAVNSGINNALLLYLLQNRTGTSTAVK